MDKELEAKYMVPFWDTETVEHETVWPILEKDGTIKPVSLLYPIEEILSVTDSTLEETYLRGRDYDTADGRLIILPDGSISCTPYDRYYPAEAVNGGAFPRTGGGLILFGEGSSLYTLQITVTYRTAGKWDGPIPTRQGDRISRFHDKLKDGRPVNVLFYGDSITTGANSSGNVGVKPFAKDWCQMVTDALAATCCKPKITYKNTAVGGTTSDWGREQAQERAAMQDPDLALIAFGMNCGSARMAPEVFQANIRSIMDTVLASRPDCQFVLISTTLPNQDVAGFFGNQPLYSAVLEALADEYNGKGVGTAFVNMTEMHAYLLTRKRFCDMTGNNVNHPNDFLARVYAQTVSETLALPESV